MNVLDLVNLFHEVIIVLLHAIKFEDSFHLGDWHLRVTVMSAYELAERCGNNLIDPIVI